MDTENLEIGTHYAYLQVDAGLAGNFVFVIALEVLEPVGVEEDFAKATLLVHPNPFTDKATFKLICNTANRVQPTYFRLKRKAGVCSARCYTGWK